ncbi:MAG: hypothetical protein WA702_27315 [Bradyrhizobium sp.]|uniref:hypothetical protein n=1 Tax=Bradyrhizobium sp. TaxID=376 RepID=UPI003C7CB1D7
MDNFADRLRSIEAPLCKFIVELQFEAIFAKMLGKTVTAGLAACHAPGELAVPKTRVRMPSKLEAHIAAIGGWLRRNTRVQTARRIRLGETFCFGAPAGNTASTLNQVSRVAGP